MAKKVNYKSLLAKEQKAFLTLVKKMPKFNTRSTPNQGIKLAEWILDFKPALTRHLTEMRDISDDLWLSAIGQHDLIRPKARKTTTLSARGWHKDHYNYNKAEKHELPPSLRRTPARNVTKAGTKRKRKTNIKRYK